MMLPYQDLHIYIYEISGEVLGSKRIFKEDFLGCWNEGEIEAKLYRNLSEVQGKNLDDMGWIKQELQRQLKSGT